jgi:hypothetical protein
VRWTVQRHSRLPNGLFGPIYGLRNIGVLYCLAQNVRGFSKIHVYAHIDTLNADVYIYIYTQKSKT